MTEKQMQEPVKVWCETCEGTGAVYQEHQKGCWVGGEHSCPDCDGNGYYTTPPAAQRQWVGLTDESVVSAAARVLSDRVAASCNVDCGDQWMLYGNDYIQDARAALEAAEAKLHEKNT